MSAVIESPFAGQQQRGAVAETSGARQSQARELAEMQTKFLMAERFPRDERRAMDAIINAFSRPTLAEIANYEYAKGGSSVSGLSIHSMQAIAQQWGNMEFGWSEVSRGTGEDGVPYSEVRAFAWDLQSRTCRPLQFIVRHWRDTRGGGYKLKDEREVYELCANMAQRRVRACLMAVIPKDVQDAAEQQAALTLKVKADTSPEAMAKMLDAFAPHGVTKDHIEKRIQRRLDAISPAQVVSLKRIYASLRDEMSTAAEWFDMGETPTPTDPNGSIEKVRAATAAKKSAARKPAAAQPSTGAAPAAPNAGPSLLPEYLAKLEEATSSETAALLFGEASDVLGADDLLALTAAYEKKYPPGK
jgi:hypothetical protein